MHIKSICPVEDYSTCSMLMVMDKGPVIDYVVDLSTVDFDHRYVDIKFC